MAKQIIFKHKDKEFPFAPQKVDRKKLYGWRDTYAVDDKGEQCELVHIDEYGTTIIPKGGMGLGILSPDNQWVNRSELKAVNAEGEAVEKVPSSFSAPIELDETAGIDEFLDHEITSIYALEGEENNPELVKAVAALGDQLYTFVFNYREDYEGDPAFLMEKDEQLFILIGKKKTYSFCALEQLAEVEEAVEEDDDDEMDFGMM
ncbi:MAG: hypothetical protein GY765_32180 [bacterium]|nr:hypothetical protein [bacterium]